MGVVDEAIEDGIGQGWVAYSLVPVFDGQLAGDDSGSAAVAVFEDFQKVTAFRSGEDSKAPIVDDQHIHAGDGFQDAFVAALISKRGAAGQSEGLEHAWGALIEDGPPIPTRLVAKSAGDPAFAEARGSGDQQVLMPGDPSTARQTTLDAAFLSTPERFVRKRPKPP